MTWSFALYPRLDILSQPESQPVEAGATATFTVVTACSRIDSYQWQFNGANLSDNGRIVGSLSGSLSVSNVQADDAGGYSVLVTDPGVPGSLGAVTSSVATLTVLVLSGPSVPLTYPTNGASFPAGATLTLVATASDPQGTVTQVEFFQGGTNLLGVATNAPYSVVWSNAPAGSYVLTAQATDSRRAVGVSAAVNVTVTNPAPPALTVDIISPANFSSFCLGADVQIQAAVSGAASPVEVKFFAGSTLLSPATSAPYQWDWPSPQVGSYALLARVTDNQGRSADSAQVFMSVVAQCADSAIIQPQADPEIEALQTYLYQMGLGSQVFDQPGLSFGDLSWFKLVIWDDLGLLTNGLTANTVDVLSRLYANGMPLYLAGEHLASSLALLPPAQQVEWTNLTHLSPATGTVGDGTIVVTNAEGPSNPILFGTYGVVTNLPYLGQIDLANDLNTNAEVFGTTLGASVLAAFPGLEQPDQSPTGLWLQSVRISAPGSPGSAGPLQALFQNAVCWLTKCPLCGGGDFGVGLTGVQSNAVVEAGQVVSYTLSASFNGECPATGVTLTNQLPAGFQFISATSEQGTWTYDAVNGRVMFFLGLVAQDAVVDLGISSVPLLPGTFTNMATIRFNSSDPSLTTALLDPALVTTVLPNTNAPPLLTLQPLAGPKLRLTLFGQPGTPYEIDSSTDLSHWAPLTNVLGPTGTQTFTPRSGANSVAQFCRAKVTQ